jgi:predicted transcriptional regulator
MGTVHPFQRVNIRTGIIPQRRVMVKARMSDSNEPRVFVAVIRRLLAARGWRQHDLAAAAGVMPNTITDVLNGRNPRIDTLTKVAAAFKVPLWTLFVPDTATVADIIELVESRSAARLPSPQKNRV